MLEIFSAFHWFCHWFEIQWCCKRPNLYCRTWLCVLQGKSLVQCHQAFFKFISSCLLGSIISASQFFFFLPGSAPCHSVILCINSELGIGEEVPDDLKTTCVYWNGQLQLWAALPHRTLFWSSMVVPFLLCFPWLSLFIILSGDPIVLSIFSVWSIHGSVSVVGYQKQ